MKALVYTRPGIVEVLDVDGPEPAAGETVVNVGAAGICGSELHGISSPGFRTPPLVMGHELAGETDDGRRVAVNPIIACGACDRCAIGRTQVCRQRSIVGIHRAGGFAEAVAVPTAQLHELPPGLTFAEASMIEPLANAVHVWNLARPGQEPRVGVIGAGTIGLVSLLLAKHRGAGEVVVTDVAEPRVALAKELGADAVGSELDGEFDLVVDAVGLPATHRASVERLAPGGTAVWLGLMSDDAGFGSLDLIRQEKRVLGSFAYTDEEFAEAVRLAPECDLSWVQEFPLSEGARLFADLMNGRTDIVKAVLTPSA